MDSKIKSRLEQIYWDHYQDFVSNPDNLNGPLMEYYDNQIDTDRFIACVKSGCFHEIGVYPGDKINIHDLIDMKARLMGLEDDVNNIDICDLAEALGRIIEYGKKVEYEIYEESARSDYEEGVALYNDPSKRKSSYFYLDSAATMGSLEACLFLGKIHMLGIEVPENTLRGIHYYYLAAKLGSPEAHFNLGLCYLHGLGVIEDLELAERYMKFALDHGVEEAKAEIENIHSSK